MTKLSRFFSRLGATLKADFTSPRPSESHSRKPARGFAIDVKHRPMTRRGHALARLGCLGGLLCGLALVYGLAHWLDARSGAWYVIGSVVLYLLGGALGMDIGVLFEGYPRYLERYQAQLDDVHRESAALFERDGSPDSGDRP